MRASAAGAAFSNGGADASPAEADVLEQKIIQAREFIVGMAILYQSHKHLPGCESDGHEVKSMANAGSG